MDEILLNNAQKDAINHTSGEMLVVAGAGTGKTKVIVERIAKLIEDGNQKSSILALTFTEKAAQEMLDRVSERIQESYGVDLNIFTFNAFGQELLQEFAVDIGLSSNLTLVGEEGKVVFMREHLDEFELDYFSPASNPDGQITTIGDYFSQLKQQLILPDIYKTFADKLPTSDDAEKLEKKKNAELSFAYKKYIELMRAENIVDYDDQIYLAVELLSIRPNILKKLQERYAHIMVDEFQDTNPMQSRLVELIYGDKSKINLHESETVSVQSSESQVSRIEHTTKRDSQSFKPKMSARGEVQPAQQDGSHLVSRSLMVVGDDDQAIYGWRGATLANILDFTKKYPTSEQVTLIDNYRSTQEILDSAWHLIQNNNPDRLEHINKLDKRLKADRGSGKAPSVMEFVQRDGELAWVAEDIKRRIARGQDPGSMAVLARSRQLAADMHIMLDIFDIDHATAGLGEDLFQQDIVLMMVDCLKAVWDPKQSTSLYHTLSSRIFSCDQLELSELTRDAKTKHIPLITVLKKASNSKIQEAVKQIESWHLELNSSHVRQMSYRIITESGLKDTLYERATSDEAAARDVQILSQWFKSLQEFERISVTPSVHSYLENFAVLRAEGETLRDGTLEVSNQIPTVMTVHKSKGLEWQTVYLVNCNAGSFPYLGGSKGLQVPDELRNSSEADERLAEERRLMYVAATRARDELVISYSSASRTGKTTRKPSKFIEEMGLNPTENEHITNSANLELSDDSAVGKVSLPNSMKEGDNIVLTASQVEDYLINPREFYFKHVLAIPEEPSHQAAIGSLYHDILEGINKAKLHGSEPLSLDHYISIIKQAWPETGYESKKQRDRDLQHALESFPELYDRVITEPVPVAVEKKFRLLVPDSKCILKGRIDAVMPTEDGVEIHDYKTSTSVTDPETAKRRTTSSKQLTMYALAWQLQSGEMPKQVSLDFVRTGEKGTVTKQSKSLDTMATAIAEVAEKILAGEFPDTGERRF